MMLPHVVCPAARPTTKAGGILCPSSVSSYNHVNEIGQKEITFDAVFLWTEATLEILDRAMKYKSHVQLRLPIQGGYKYPLVRIRSYNYPLAKGRDILATFSYVKGPHG